MQLQPYIMKAIFSAENPPVKLSKAAIGNGAFGTLSETQQLTAVWYHCRDNLSPFIYRLLLGGSH